MAAVAETTRNADAEPLLASAGRRRQSSCDQVWQLWSTLRCQSRTPHDIRVTSTSDWVDCAAQSIVRHGVCCLRPLASSRHTLLPASLIERCRSDVRPRLDRYLDLARRASAAGGSLRFQELTHVRRGSIGSTSRFCASLCAFLTRARLASRGHPCSPPLIDCCVQCSARRGSLAMRANLRSASRRWA